MNIEIEKKFLLVDRNLEFDLLMHGISDVILIQQAYFNTLSNAVRVRHSTYNGEASSEICIKTSNPSGVGCLEFEYPIPVNDAITMIEMLPDLVVKKRYKYKLPSGLVWEIDEFMGEFAGIIVAEIELTSADQSFDMLPGKFMEVTDNHKFSNKSMAINRDKSFLLEGTPLENY